MDSITNAMTGMQLDDMPVPIEQSTACSYCCLQDPASVAKCNICSKWFCNGQVNGAEGSHIVHHLLQANHSEVSLHEGGPLGQTNLQCHSCGDRNIFNLGIVLTEEESSTVLLCRQPCSAQNLQNAIGGQIFWEPLISDRLIHTWLVNTTSDQLQLNSITVEQINQLEEIWKTNPNATFQDVNCSASGRNSLATPIRFENCIDYQKFFGPLIQLESDYSKRLKGCQAQTNIEVRWETGLNQKTIAYFKLANTHGDVKLMFGRELVLRQIVDHCECWNESGYVIKVPDQVSDEIGLELMESQAVPYECTSNYTVEFIWKGTSYERMRFALFKFSSGDNGLSHYLYSRLIGDGRVDNLDQKIYNGDLPDDLCAPNLPGLNSSQMAAVRHAVQRPLSLIQGPPGTGKTVTSATIVYQLSQRSRDKILVCAPSNTAVDQLAERIQQTNLNVVRVYSKPREAVNSPVGNLALHNQILQLPKNAELKSLQELKDEMGGLHWKDGKRYSELKWEAERELLESADVICCTCITAGDSRLKRISFAAIVIDECMQTTEPECMVPIILGTRQLILVGDHRQLGPVVMCKNAADGGLSLSLFERLVAIGVTPFRLDIQYRMHPNIAEFPSTVFYDGSLQNGVSTEERVLNLNFPWPRADCPMFFLDTRGPEEFAGTGTSYINRMEAASVEEITTRFLIAGLNPEQIGIITPYEGQRFYLEQNMQHSGIVDPQLYQRIEVASVDAFQGREKDIIIISCVRSNEYQGIGFLSDPRRLNVALTRAKYGMIIVGNAEVLSKDPLWQQLLNFYIERGVFVKGSTDFSNGSHNPFQEQALQHHSPILSQMIPAGSSDLEYALVPQYGAVCPEEDVLWKIHNQAHLNTLGDVEQVGHVNMNMSQSTIDANELPGPSYYNEQYTPQGQPFPPQGMQPYIGHELTMDHQPHFSQNYGQVSDMVAGRSQEFVVYKGEYYPYLGRQL